MSWDHRRPAVHKVIHSDIHCDIHCRIHKCLRRVTEFGPCPHARDWAVVLITTMLAKTSVAGDRHEIEQGRHSSRAQGRSAPVPGTARCWTASRNSNVFPVGLKIFPPMLQQIHLKANQWLLSGRSGKWLPEHQVHSCLTLCPNSDHWQRPPVADNRDPSGLPASGAGAVGRKFHSSGLRHGQRPVPRCSQLRCGKCGRSR
jgi:hypothetical protein